MTIYNFWNKSIWRKQCCILSKKLLWINFLFFFHLIHIYWRTSFERRSWSFNILSKIVWNAVDFHWSFLGFVKCWDSIVFHFNIQSKIVRNAFSNIFHFFFSILFWKNSDHDLFCFYSYLLQSLLPDLICIEKLLIATLWFVLGFCPSCFIPVVKTNNDLQYLYRIEGCPEIGLLHLKC